MVASPRRVAQKAATLLIYFIFPFIVLGYIASSGLTAWFRSLYQGRMMLRSLAARREANNEVRASAAPDMDRPPRLAPSRFALLCRKASPPPARRRTARSSGSPFGSRCTRW